MSDSLGNRMKKNYEMPWNITLPRRLPVIIRIDGRAFHTLARRFDRPFDDKVRELFLATTGALCRGMTGAKFGYTQSDEISILLTNDDTLDTHAWFDNKLLKLVSVSASMATVVFNKVSSEIAPSVWNDMPTFDARAFVLPREEVVNYFIWRQRDWERNSLMMLARAHYSQKQLDGKKKAEIHEMLHRKDVNWNDLPTKHKRGCAVYLNENGQWLISEDIPDFSKDRSFIESVMRRKE